jgi:outer membrane protein OmpA-like peptidoglycan-associated protein
MNVLLGVLIALLIMAIVYLGSLKNHSTTAVQTQPPATLDVKQAPSVQLPTFRADSTEQKLAAFLNDSSAVINQENGTWFNFDQVTFATGSAALSDSSMEQLKNVAAVMTRFPNATFKIGGYTDNVGKPDANKKLSQARATSVFEQLKKLGIPGTQLTGAEGYGSEHPIADNSTEEGRAKNRRMSLRVQSK